MNRIIKIIISLIALAAFLFCVALIHVRTDLAIAHRQSRFICRAYKTQELAQEAYKDGAYYLDGNGDGLACNSYFK